MTEQIAIWCVGIFLELNVKMQFCLTQVTRCTVFPTAVSSTFSCTI